ncbi:MAG TPA: YqeG family HAD IIIA-type phosphatase [Firmicutes bacterium]|nr:YqeG family HAD IIIA-type phosphatase [Bacillota bacterium]
MLEILCPDLYVDSICNIDLDKLRKLGIRGIIFDIDNTIVEWGSNQVDPETERWIARAKDSGFRMCILSNNLRRRIKLISEVLGIPYTPAGIKPRKAAFLRAVKLLGTRVEETAVVGDQLFTDILGGNLSGLFTILVKPLCRREFITTRFMRVLERLVMRHLKCALFGCSLRRGSDATL